MKFYKNKFLLFALVCLIISSNSCKKELLVAIPPTVVADATAFDTPDRILNQLRSLYAGLKNGNFYGGRYIVYGDIRGEDFINETSNLVTGNDVWNLNPQNSSQNSVKNLWAQAYFTINISNVFLDGMEVKGSKVVGETLSKNYIAEARLIRALAYYSLLQLYARPFADGAGSKPGLPLRLKGITASGSSDLARSTVAEVYTQILADLNFAETNLALNNGSAVLNTTRAHRNTAIALKTRVYLTMQNYTAVITEANKIVTETAPFTSATGVPHAIQANIVSVFTAPYTTTESIFSMPMSATAGDNPGTQNQLGFYFVQNGSALGNAEYSLNPNGILGDTVRWRNADARRTGLVFTNTSSNKRYLAKYRIGAPYTDFPPVIRYSEVLLNLAEALARTNTGVADSRALALVNAVRRRSDASNIVVAANQADLITAILLERRIEFLGEGMRSNDLLRLLQTIPAKGSVPSKSPTDQGYIWPISSDELSLNTLMTDN